MTWTFLYVNALKARWALPHMSFVEECWWRLIWYNQRPSGLHVISHKATVPMVDMANHFKFSIICKWISPFLLGKLLFYTWLITPCRKWGQMKSSSATKLPSHKALRTTEKQPDTVMGLCPCTPMQAENCLALISILLPGPQLPIIHSIMSLAAWQLCFLMENVTYFWRKVEGWADPCDRFKFSLLWWLKKLS